MSVGHQSLGSLGWAKPDFAPSASDLSGSESKRWHGINSFFKSGLPTPPGPEDMPGVVLNNNNYAGYPVSAYQHDRSYHEASNSSHAYRESSASATISSQAPASSSSSSSAAASTSLYNRRANNQNDANAIAPYLQIPASVNKSKGSLAEFAAEITCLFWFETANTLQYAEDVPETTPILRRLLPDATPTIGFRKWVTTIISTTQVGKNVILLALMFIYRLKRFNPGVSGKRGSEFRLLTVALMLGNKFLDDNTYTNKTWAEVSGISVTEIHIMEVEFLSNMRYELYVSAEEWGEWKTKLGRFGAFYQKTKKLAEESRSNRVSPVTPTNQSFPHKLPSPPSTHHSANSHSAPTSLHSHYPVLPHPVSSAATSSLPQSPLRYQVGRDNHALERKRSADFSAELPHAKRQLFATQNATQMNGSSTQLPYPSSAYLRYSPTHSTSSTGSGSAMSQMSRLDIPGMPNSIPSMDSQFPPLAAQPSRAMLGVYPTTTNSYSHPVTPLSAIPQNVYQLPMPSLGDGARALSNHPSAHTSPSSNGCSTAPVILPGLSPSYFLTNRASPYRPVRHVDTLLYPPPSAALQMPDRNLSYDHMHYQPLSKAATERRPGPLPFYQPEGWQHSNVSTPISHQQQYQF